MGQRFFSDIVPPIRKISSSNVQLDAADAFGNQTQLTLGGQQYGLLSPLSLNIGVLGAGGIDVGTVAVNRMYVVYAVVSSGLPALIFSLSGSGPVGFPSFKFLGYLLTDSTPNVQDTGPKQNFITSSSATFTTSSGSPQPVTNLSMEIINIFGRKFRTSLEGVFGDEAYIQASILGASVVCEAHVQLYRDATLISESISGGEANSLSVFDPVSGIRFSEAAPLGRFTYSVKLFTTDNGGGSSASIVNGALRVEEILDQGP
jgi:hypothetical protein